jgi:hypothetical protein
VKILIDPMHPEDILNDIKDSAKKSLIDVIHDALIGDGHDVSVDLGGKGDHDIKISFSRKF